MTPRHLTFIAAFFSFLSLLAQHNESVHSNFQSDSYRQFDFWMGEWDVNLRIKNDSGVWNDQVQSTARIYRLLDGKAILELWNENKVGTGIKGYSLRYFHEEKNKWELWLNWPGRNTSGTNSLEGSFRHGRGEFFSQFPKNDSVTITQRYTFCDISPTSLRWDNAFSEDGGKTWREGNWIMEFSRKRDLPPAIDKKPLTFDSGNRCDLTQFDYFDSWMGEWKGEMKFKENDHWNSSPATLKVYPVLDGCSILTFLTFEKGEEKIKSFSLKTFNTYANIYEEGVLDNQPNSPMSMRYGSESDQGLTFMNRDRTIKSVWQGDEEELTWRYFEMENGEWEEKQSLSLRL